MNSRVLRQKYLDFFKARNHVIVPSAPLVPENDPTTLFTGSGMQPMIQYLLGTPHPKGVRIADSQKCFRSQDIEEVGDNRHTTFFEVLGNWSLGDYFKEEQLAWYFSFLTDELGLDPQRIYVTVYRGDKAVGVPRDDEATSIWQKLFKEKGIEAAAVDKAWENGMQGGRIFYYSDKNWWSRAGAPAVMPVGEPGGPDSEVFFDFGEEKKFHENSVWKNESCHVNCDCGRFGEIGNSVFMQYMKTDKGFEPLPQKNIDFGGGLERMLAAQNDEPDVFKIDLFAPIIQYVETVSGKKYEGENTAAFRVIADHMRAAVMLIADGVLPSNKDQGYFVRRLIRRAVRYGRQLGITQPFLSEMSGLVAGAYEGVYPALSEQSDTISHALADEEKKFLRTLERGLQEFEKQTKDSSELTAQLAFALYESYGFPLELSVEEAKNKKLKISQKIQEEFQKIKSQHSSQSRTASAGKFKGGLADTSETSVKYHTATHLLHAALRKILGTHVEQKGSNITGERLRFDFTHPVAVTDAEKQQVERQMNEWIAADMPVTRQTMQKDEAFKAGALAFFAEKYPDQVSVYTIGSDAEKDWISKELCGGPHVQHTVEIGPVEIFKEKAVAAGIRRIYVRLATAS
jgi:alanyl-tRNA synthetase